MPFDGVDFQPKREQPDRPAANERIYSLLFLVIAIFLLVMPISMAGLVDIVRYLQGP